MGARDLEQSGFLQGWTLALVVQRAIAPRKPITVSQWSDLNRRLSSKGSALAGRWVTDRNPPLREPMDAMSSRSPVREVVLCFPIQFGKSEVALNALGYTMDHNPGPVMVCLPGEVSMHKWIAQKLNPMIEETPAVREVLTSTTSRDAANRREFKDFAGGQLYMEHAGSPVRLKSTSVRTLLVDEIDEFSTHLHSGDDPVDLLNGRTSAFPGTYKRLYISTPTVRGLSRIEQLYEQSDQRRFYVACPHCGHEQHLQWAGLRWQQVGDKAHSVRYVCTDCGGEIEEHQKTELIAHGRWVPGNPGATTRGYHINALYYQIGLGPRWADLVEAWIRAQNDPAKLKTFVNDRLAETWEDQAMRAVRHNAVADRAEAYPVRLAPDGVLAITAGVDTQDNRLAVHITGWGRGMAFWTLDYVELPGDPANEEVWTALTDLLNQEIPHASGGSLPVLCTAIDTGGHRGEAVKNFVRQRRIRRPMAIFGATANTAPVLAKPKAHDVTWRGQVDRRGVMMYAVGTVAVKHWLFSRLSTDSEKPLDRRLTHFSQDLPPEYFAGLVSETFNPAKNRFDKRRGARNEPLDTFVYSLAAAHHPELRLHQYTDAKWRELEVDQANRRALLLAAPSASAVDDNTHKEAAAAARNSITPAEPPLQPLQAMRPRAAPTFSRRW